MITMAYQEGKQLGARAPERSPWRRISTLFAVI